MAFPDCLPFAFRALACVLYASLAKATTEPEKGQETIFFNGRNGLLQQFRADRVVTRETMFGVLCIYLLLGMLFSASFGFCLLYTSDAADE